MADTFSITSTGEASYTMPLLSVPARAGVGAGLEPELALTYDSAGEDGILGAGFSLAGLSSISRCAKNLAQDGEIRSVRYDASDQLCLDGTRLVPVGQQPGIVEYRTFPDTFTKVIGHFPPEGAGVANALFFEVTTPSGLVVEYGSGEGSKPLARAGVPRAWLAAKAHDGRLNTVLYNYCFADGDGTTAEYALDEIRYTGFEGSPSLEPSRAVKLVYGTKDPADVRRIYSAGVALQSSLRLEEIQMLGPGDALVRKYRFSYGLGPTTQRTLLAQVEECAADEVCKPPTRFQFSSRAAGFERHTTSLPKPVSAGASPMLLDIDGDGLDDLVLPDTDPLVSIPINPVTAWLVAPNQGSQGGSNTAPYFAAPATLALSEEWPIVTDPSGPADPMVIQPELGTAIDYDDDGRTEIDQPWCAPSWVVYIPPLPSSIAPIRNLPAAKAASYPLTA